METPAELPYAHGGPAARAILRSTPEDFFVDEQLGFTPDGEGEHVFIRIEKRGANTEWVARQLARHAGVAPGAVSFAGMKDRHAVTRQTFSVHLPGKAGPDWPALQDAEFTVLEVSRHRRKLQRGALQANAFRIVLREVSGDRATIDARVQSILQAGVPNYFGEQRFGREGSNVEQALAMFAGKRVDRQARGMLLSAARSHLFNALLAERVRLACWNRSIDGDVWMLAGTQSIFGPEPFSAELIDRIVRGDISPTGPLWGSGELRTRGEAARLERAVEQACPALAQGLADNGLRQERRALVLRPQDLSIRWLADADLCVSFSLSKGSYATVVLRELARCDERNSR